MSKGIFIVGTDTDVGKTFVTTGLISLLKFYNKNTCYFKPVLSGAILKDEALIPGDTEFVKSITGIKEDNNTLTPYIFKNPVSPHLAATLENKKIELDVIKEKLKILTNKYDYIVAEGAGGLIVPLNAEGYMLSDLILDLNMDIVIVAKAGLGTINHTLLTIEYAKKIGLKVKGIIINNYNSAKILEKDNIKMIENISKVPLLGVVPHMEKFNIEIFKKIFSKEKLLEIMKG